MNVFVCVCVAGGREVLYLLILPIPALRNWTEIFMRTVASLTRAHIFDQDFYITSITGY